ncbi:MAG: hypothetical protein EHM77_01455 [Planctomycetaceae bacterium]|nr:MAG: hypothetical protein EHM77_01455 [Planctomycetaceae bacterium]
MASELASGCTGRAGQVGLARGVTDCPGAAQTGFLPRAHSLTRADSLTVGRLREWTTGGCFGQVVAVGADVRFAARPGCAAQGLTGIRARAELPDRPLLVTTGHAGCGQHGQGRIGSESGIGPSPRIGLGSDIACIAVAAADPALGEGAARVVGGETRTTARVADAGARVAIALLA